MSEPTTDRQLPEAPAADGSRASEPVDRPVHPPRAGAAGSAGSRQAEPGVDRQAASAEPAPPVPSPPAAPRKPQIGDTRPAPAAPRGAAGGPSGGAGSPRSTEGSSSGSRRRRGGRGRRRGGGGGTPGEPSRGGSAEQVAAALAGEQDSQAVSVTREGTPAARSAGTPASDDDAPQAEAPGRSGRSGSRSRRGRDRGARATGRYLMCVHVESEATQIAVLEGRALVEHYVARPRTTLTRSSGTSTEAA